MHNRHPTRLSLILIACAALLVFSAPLTAALQVREQAHELNLSQVLRWPLGTGDSLVFRRCADCATETLKLAADASFFTQANGTKMTLSDLLRVKTGIRHNQEHVITVFYLPESREITRLIIQTEF